MHERLRTPAARLSVDVVHDGALQRVGFIALSAVQLLDVLPELHVEKEGYTVTGVLSDEDGKKMWLTADVTVCVPNAKEHGACVSNDAEYCPYRGCFDTPDEYLLMRVTFERQLADSAVARPRTGTTSIFPATRSSTATDASALRWTISFSAASGSARVRGRQAVLDVKYIDPLCGNRRLRRVVAEGQLCHDIKWCI